MKIILTKEDVKKILVLTLRRAGQLSEEVDYDVKITDYGVDYMVIEPVAKETKEDK